jgi:hypothetical protein
MGIQTMKTMNTIKIGDSNHEKNMKDEKRGDWKWEKPIKHGGSVAEDEGLTIEPSQMAKTR